MLYLYHTVHYKHLYRRDSSKQKSIVCLNLSADDGLEMRVNEKKLALKLMLAFKFP